ncbi:MAG: hypothetical protein M3P50_08825 [Actinomycetota bacterium]|nr:hypothetical protein [Actinomycetota bacterium]
MRRAPDLVAPVIGFRAWRLGRDRLLSPYIPCRWEGRTMHAECYDANRTLLRGEGWLAGPHPSPHPSCQCGIYAYHRPGLRAYYGEWAWAEGIIAAWGRIEVHADGFRSEHARIEALARPDREEPAVAATIERVAADLGVPLLAREELAGAAGSFGATLPDSMLPTG